MTTHPSALDDTPIFDAVVADIGLAWPPADTEEPDTAAPATSHDTAGTPADVR